MKPISLVLIASIPLYATAQTVPVPPEQGEPPPEPGALGQFIGTIAASDSPSADDFKRMAIETLQLGQSAQQRGASLTNGVIYDALDAVDQGEAMQPGEEWQALREALEALLEEPPPNDQEQQQENQDQSQDDSQNEENNDGSSGENGEQGDSEENQDHPDDQDQPDPGDSEQQENQSGEPNDSQQQGNQSEQQSGSGPKNQPSLGEMETPEQPQIDQPQRDEPKRDKQQVGGTQQPQAARSAKQAMLAQQLEQLKQQDKPGTLHMLLQEAERGEDSPPDRRPQQDW